MTWRGTRTSGVARNRSRLGTRHGIEPYYWCDWQPSPDGSQLAIPAGWHRGARVAEWLVFLQRHFLAPTATARSQRRFARFTFDHEITGVVRAQGEVDGDRWGIVASAGGEVHVERDHLPCAPCWNEAVRWLVTSSAVYGFTHPDPRGNADPARRIDWNRNEIESLRGECRAGAFVPREHRRQVEWPFSTWPWAEPSDDLVTEPPQRTPTGWDSAYE